ncbi:hypothetical protein [Nostoc sp. TCL26-01]|nr:hypothetical protein [Nostoc sp. TCL26-01]
MPNTLDIKARKSESILRLDLSQHPHKLSATCALNQHSLEI